jgi:hypothetical protein
MGYLSGKPVLRPVNHFWFARDSLIRNRRWSRTYRGAAHLEPTNRKIGQKGRPAPRATSTTAYLSPLYLSRGEIKPHRGMTNLATAVEGYG